jgi:outer membrane protein assembly factor BamB
MNTKLFVPVIGFILILLSNVTLCQDDWGDAPDPFYPTLFINDGARHGNANPGIFLGLLKDFEVDGQPNNLATGDDINGDDEDGVILTTPMVIGSTTNIIVVANTGGFFLNAWCDFNTNGYWGDSGEQIFTNVILVSGSNPLSFSVPYTAVAGATFLRFRYSSIDSLSFTGYAIDGEVEDYMDTIYNPPDLDYGDAPDYNYQTYLASDGARHGNSPPGIFLGNLIDVDTDGQPDLYALGDDLANLDDEDGVKFLCSLVQGQPCSLSVTASAYGMLDAWVDFDGNGDWTGINEQIFVAQVLFPGPNILSFNVPIGTITGLTYARFRFSVNGGLNSFGPSSNGEVEDYEVLINVPLDSKMHFTQYPDPGGWDVDITSPDVVADDWLCTESGAVNEIHFWMSAQGGYGNIMTINSITVSVHADIPASQSPTGYSMPSEPPLWEQIFLPSQFSMSAFLHYPQGWYSPGDSIVQIQDHYTCFQVDIDILDQPFIQQQGTIYWLKLMISSQSPEIRFGWKSSLDHWNDDAVWNIKPYEPLTWHELIDPITEESMDMAFSLEERTELDYGDAIDPPYPTTLANNGARHGILNPTLFLGTNKDLEPEGPGTFLANWDDLDNIDDEDGIIFIDPLIPGALVNINAIANQGGGYLNAWCDFDNNGNWLDIDDQIITDQILVTGSNPLSFIMPPTANSGAYYFRFRYSSITGISFNGLVADGETEDYRVIGTNPLSGIWKYVLHNNVTRMEYGASPAIKDLGPEVNIFGSEPNTHMEIVTGSDEYNNYYPELKSDAYGIWRCFDAIGNLEWAKDTKSDEARSSVGITDIDWDLEQEIAGGTTSGWCVEVMNRFGSWTPGVSDATWTFPYPPYRNGPFMWHSSPALGELITGQHLEGLELVIGNNPYYDIWAFDGDNSDGVDDGMSVSGWPGVEGEDWDVLWKFQTLGNVIATPAIGDVDNDDQNEVVIGSKDNKLYCLAGNTGNLEWSFTTGNQITGSAGLADFDNDGDLEVVVGSYDFNVYFIDGDENSNGIIDVSEYTLYATAGLVYSSPSIADLDLDGNLEIVIGSNDANVYCFRYFPLSDSISVIWTYTTASSVCSSPAIANSGRASLSVYVGSEDGNLYLINGANGTLLGSCQTFGYVRTSPVVADIDNDNKLEIAFTTWNSVLTSRDEIWVLRDNGSSVTGYSTPWTMFRHDECRTGFYNWTAAIMNNDVGTLKISEPVASVISGVLITPRATVHNFGNNPQINVPVTFEIRNSSNTLVYTSTQNILSLPVNATTEVIFPGFTASVGYFTTKAYTSLTGDQNADNNSKVGFYLVPDPSWIENFETTDGTYSADPGVNAWEWGIPTVGPSAAHSGTKCWGTNLNGDYDNDISWKLTSPDMIAQQNDPILCFWHWYNIETCRDGGNVKISINGGVWQLVYPIEGYSGTGSWNNMGIPDEPCWNGSSAQWKFSAFILPVNAGQTFQIRWHLGTDATITRAGWYIDDVMAQGIDPSVPPEQMILRNVTVGPGDQCFDAKQTITVAGNGTSFTVLSSGAATLIAGQKITFYPESNIFSGGYMHAYITTNNQYCGISTIPLASNEDDTEEYPIPDDKNKTSFFKVYPNPTPGTFTLELLGNEEILEIDVTIYSMMGKQVLHHDFAGQKKYILTLGAEPSGIYLIRVLKENAAGITKIVKQ